MSHRRAPRFHVDQHHPPLPCSRAHTAAPAVRRSPRPSSSASSLLSRRPSYRAPTSSAPPPSRSPSMPVVHSLPSSSSLWFRRSPAPPATCCVPRSPPAPLDALDLTHIWVGRGRGSPVRSSGDPLPRCQVPRAIWRGARGTASDTQVRIAREVAGQVGPECRSQRRAVRRSGALQGGGERTSARRLLPPALATLRAEPMPRLKCEDDGRGG